MRLDLVQVDPEVRQRLDQVEVRLAGAHDAEPAPRTADDAVQPLALRELLGGQQAVDGDERLLVGDLVRPDRPQRLVAPATVPEVEVPAARRSETVEVRHDGARPVRD